MSTSQSACPVSPVRLAVTLACLASLAGLASGQTISLTDIDSGLTSPTGNYRWLNIADQAYKAAYRTGYNYTQASVQVTFDPDALTLHGTLSAANLKPNFAYQLKLAGYSDTPSNERIGLSGRWWQEEWNGTKWANGQNLNDKGVTGTSPNPNDAVYLARRDIPDASSPSGKHYRYTGYTVFDYFITDNNGNASLSFGADSCYHVLWKTSQRGRTASDGPIKTSSFDVGPPLPAYDTDHPAATVGVYGEWERLPVGGVPLSPGDYACQIILTEECFHGSGGQYAGGWAAAMGADINFHIVPEPTTLSLLALAGLALMLRRAR
jgi:hypothetical protein